MTADGMAPIDRIETGADGDLVRDLPGRAAERGMEWATEARTGAPEPPAPYGRPALLHLTRGHDPLHRSLGVT